MQVIYDYQQLPTSLQGAIVTIGNFDGVHRGHQALIRRLQQQQACYRNNQILNHHRQDKQVLVNHTDPENNHFENDRLKTDTLENNTFKTVVILFEPQPKEYFCPGTAPARIYSLEQKLQALRRLKVDGVLVLRFDDTLRHLSSHDFVQNILLDGLKIRHLVIGDDFRFGNDRKGDFSFLQTMAQQTGFVLEQSPTVTDKEGDRISSTLIRQCLHQGAIGRARALIGRTHYPNLQVA